MKIINWCVPFSISFLNELESFWFVLQLFMTTWWQRKIGNTKQIFTNSIHTHEQQYTVSRTNKAHSYSSSVMSRMNNHQKKVYSKQDPKMVCLATKACKQEIAKMESLTKNGVVTKFLAMSHQKFTLRMSSTIKVKSAWPWNGQHEINPVRYLGLAVHSQCFDQTCLWNSLGKKWSHEQSHLTHRSHTDHSK